MSQNKIFILSTRLVDDEFIREAKAKDVFVDVMPFIRTESISSTELQKKIKQALSISKTVVFTSNNAVEAVISEIEDQKITWRIFCIGHSTKRSVEEYFGKKSIAGVADNAKELAQLIISAGISEATFFCGDQRRDVLPDQLRKNNIEVKEVVVYKTVATPGKIKKKYDGILFFSPSAVKSFFQENKLDQQVILFAIGSVTAEEIKKFSKNKIVISEVPDKRILLDSVAAYFESNPIHH
ncbi:MAG TPA: uroporphyrinogen-III synthase [Chitinophagaceae bacterium]|nr:uroporphyrinogen-III synthase [Chitinophagaceae bacterium]